MPANAPTTPRSIAPSRPVFAPREKIVERIPTIDPNNIKLIIPIGLSFKYEFMKKCNF